MIVMPSLSEGKQCNWPVIGGTIASNEPLRAPSVRNRIDRPGAVEANHGTNENTPHQKGYTADGEQHQSQEDDWHI